MITGYFGLPGSGKSSFLAKIAKYYQKRGVRVFVNREFPIDGCYLYDWSDIGKVDMSDSVLLIDEISLFADNRDFKKFSQELKQFFILHRHYNIDVIWCTQQYDGVDRKIRELTRELYYVRTGGFYSYAVSCARYMYVPTIRDVKKNPACDVSPKWTRSGFLTLLFSPFNKTLKLCFRFLYYKYFDSYTAPEMPLKDFDYYEILPDEPIEEPVEDEPAEPETEPETEEVTENAD